MTALIADFLFSLYETAAEMAPYLLFGFFMAGLLSGVTRQETIELHLGGRGIKEILKASAFGVPLPLCSCSVIPMAVSLRSHGASNGATTAFLISTPQTGVDSILVTYGVLGPVFAGFRALAAFISGILGGGLVSIADKNNDAGAKRAANGDWAKDAPSPCGDGCACFAEGGGRISRMFRYGFVTLPRDIAKSLLTGFLVAALIAAVIPDGFFLKFFGNSFLGMISMMLLGIPLYVCATASVPLAATLIAKGMSAGSAMVFLMTGPATNAATISAVWRTMGGKTAIVYLLSIAVTAMASGAVFDAFFAIKAPAGTFSPWEIPEPVAIASIVCLIFVFAYAFLRGRFGREKYNKTQTKITLIRMEGKK